MAAIAVRVLGRLGDARFAGLHVERAEIASDDLARRIVRLQTNVGELGIRLEDGAVLREGDVVYADAERAVCIAVAPDDVLVATPQTRQAAARLGHALGNRHLPVQFGDEEIVIRYDRLVEELLEEHGVAFTRTGRTLSAPFRHAQAPHGHGEGRA